MTIDPSQIDDSAAVAEVYASLSAGVQALVLANATLFGGRWDDLAEDLRRRRAGKPFLFTVNIAVDDPLSWIARLKSYEAARGERLADAIPA